MAFFIAHMKNIDKIILTTTLYFPQNGPGIPIPNRHFGIWITSGHLSLGKETRLYRSTETWSTPFLKGPKPRRDGCSQETRLLARCVSVPSPAGVDMLETMTFGVELYRQQLFCASFLCSGCCTGYSSPRNGAGKT